MKNRQLPVFAAVLLACVVLPLSPAGAATFEIFPSNADSSCSEEYESRANSLQPGDVLILHGGIYTQTCRRAITVNGTAASPITIRAADGESPIITRPEPADFRYDQNNIDIISSSFVIIRGLHFKGGDGGINFIGGHHITLHHLRRQRSLRDRQQRHSLEQRQHRLVHHPAKSHPSHRPSGAVGRNHRGEGMYIGCHNGSCIASNHLVDGNYIHHTRGTSSGGNDGIEVKYRSFGNTIRNNVIHDTLNGTAYPCIFVYGGGPGVNIVEGNAMWNCGEAIQVVSDAIIRNNLILNSTITGISASPHNAVPQMRNVTIVNNTVYGNPTCLYVRWSSATNMVLANNAVYCSGATAVDAAGLTGSTVTVKSNYVTGSLLGASIDGSRFFAGGTPTSAFTNPAELDFWPPPGSILIGKADAGLTPAQDFNERGRVSPFDVGAYETDGRATNPGWKVGPGFKQSSPSDLIAPVAPTTLRLQ